MVAYHISDHRAETSGYAQHHFDPRVHGGRFHGAMLLGGTTIEDGLTVDGELVTQWQDYTGLVLRQGSVVSTTLNFCQYRRYFGTIDMAFRFTLTGAGTAATAVLAEGLPFDIHSSWSADAIIGIGNFLERSGSSLDWVPCTMFSDNTTQVAWRNPNAGAAVGARIGTNGFTGALASGDVIEARISYRPA